MSLACRPAATPDSDPVVPEPWAELAPIEREPFRALLEAPIEDPIAPSRIELLETHPLALVLDGDRVHVFDSRWHQSAAPACLDTEDWPQFETEGRQGRCAEGEVYLRRGAWVFDSEPVDLAVGDGEVFVVTTDGGLWRADANPRLDNPWDHLRPEHIAEVAPGMIDVYEDQLWIAGDSLEIRALDGAELEVHALPSTALAVEDGVVHVAEGLWSPEGLVELDVLGLAPGFATTTVGLYEIATGSTTSLSALGPVAADGDHVALTTPDGIWLDGELYPGAAVDLDLRGPEIALLQDTAVAVHFDETRLGGLQIAIAAFAEQPRSPAENEDCETVTRLVETAAENRCLLDDLPASVALGITPHLSRRAQSCGVREAFEPVWNDERTEVGVLFHEEPEECDDEACAADFLLSEAEAIRELSEPTWVSGLSPVEDLGLSWSDALAETDLPLRFVFFGMSVLPEIAHHTDPRSKDQWPQRLDELTAPWTEGQASLHAGDNIPAFSQGGCANLFLRECQQLGRGGGQILDDEDIIVLDLLLHRALAAEDGTWTFHLPDLGAWDYTEGCTVDGRLWSGDCGGARLQAWLFDVHARFVLDGTTEWALPSEFDDP